jgi:hypothetical protein
LSQCRHAVVVLSPNFIEKRWTNWELDGLIGRHLEMSRSLIIPIWLGLSSREIREYSPPLADIVALRANAGVISIANRILSIVTPEKTPVAPIHSASSAENAQAALLKLRDLICHSLHVTTDEAPHLSVCFLKERQSEILVVSLASSASSGVKYSFPAKHSVAGWAIHRKGRVVFDSLVDESIYTKFLLPSTCIHSELVAPIFWTKDQREVLGVISLESEHSHFFNGQHSQFFESFIPVAQMILGPLIEAHMQTAKPN